MEKFKDIWESLIAHVNERTTNPLTFSFIVSWLAWNYKFLIVLFSDLKAPEKLVLIELKYSEWNIAFQNGFLYPLITALIYVFLYPYVTDKVVRFYRSRQISLANSVRKIEQERFLTQEDANRLRRKYEMQLTKISKAETEAQEELNNVRQALEAAEAEIASLKVNDGYVPESLLIEPSQADEVVENAQIEIKLENDKLIRLAGTYPNISIKNNSLTVAKLKILSMLSSGETMSIERLVSLVAEKRFFIEVNLDELVSTELVTKKMNGEYDLNSGGRAVLHAFIKENKWSEKYI